MSVRGYLVVLICISLITNDVEHSFMCLFAVYLLFGKMSSLLFIFKLFLTLGVLYILETLIPSQLHDLEIFYSISWLSFYYLDVLMCKNFCCCLFIFEREGESVSRRGQREGDRILSGLCAEAESLIQDLNS